MNRERGRGACSPGQLEEGSLVNHPWGVSVGPQSEPIPMEEPLGATLTGDLAPQEGRGSLFQARAELTAE